MVFYKYYAYFASAALVSLITKPKHPELMSSVHELVRQEEIPWLIEAGTAFTNMGTNAEEGTTLRWVFLGHEIGLIIEI